MSTDITNLYGTKYIHDSNIFRKGGDREVIKVYVENDSDKIFWWTILEPFQIKYNVEFDISAFVFDNKTQNGKTSILSKITDEQMGRNLIVCLDSDYDELIDGFSDYSNRICQNKYIVTSFWYSIENIKCHPENLKKIITKLSLKINIPENFLSCFENISLELKEVFLYYLVFRENKVGGFCLSTFSNILGSLKFTKEGINKDILHKKIMHWKISNIILINKYIEKILPMEYKLYSMGFSDNQYYQIFNGHYFQDNIVLPLLIFWVNSYRSEYLHDLYRRQDTAKEKEKQKAGYLSNTGTNVNGVSLRECVLRELKQISTIPPCSALDKINSQIEGVFAVPIQG